MSHPMLSYIEEVDVLEGLNRTVSAMQSHIHTHIQYHTRAPLDLVD